MSRDLTFFSDDAKAWAEIVLPDDSMYGSWAGRRCRLRPVDNYVGKFKGEFMPQVHHKGQDSYSWLSAWPMAGHDDEAWAEGMAKAFGCTVRPRPDEVKGQEETMASSRQARGRGGVK